MKHRYSYLLPALLLSFSLPAFAQEETVPHTHASSIRFTENKKQWPDQVLYRAQLDGGLLFLEKNGFTYNFYDKTRLREQHAPSLKKKLKTGPLAFHAFRLSFEGSLPEPQLNATAPGSDYSNYFLGNTPSHWASQVRNYAQVYYTNLYQGIDLRLQGQDNSLKYDFILRPGADPNLIRMHYEGLEALSLDKGELELKTSLMTMTEHKPYAYQIVRGKKVTVPCRFVLENATVRFHFPKGYDKDLELIIDPLLVFAASSGSTADNFGMTATYDEHGHLYSGGTCFDAGYPYTTGAYDTTYNGIVQAGRTDVVITKYDSSGTNLIYSTYLGGATNSEIVSSLVVDKDDNLFLYGATGSSDFPITATAYDNTFNGGPLLSFVANGTRFENGTDIYVAKLNSSGTSLLASTFIGGNGNDGVNHNDVAVPMWSTFEYPLDSIQWNYGDQYRGEIVVDTLGNCYIASSSRSTNFPIVNGFGTMLMGTQDAVVFKFNSTLSTLQWSTYLGGSNKDAGNSLVLDPNLNVYVTGGTCSMDFPTVAGALNPNYMGGKADGYVSKIKFDGSQLLNSTFVGTTQYDQSYFVQTDASGDVYLFGQTLGNFPVTPGVYTTPNSGQFVIKLSTALNAILFSTRLGNGNGQTNISPSAFLVDCKENIYLSGWGGNIITGIPTVGMPITTDAQQQNTDGFNFHLMVLSTNAATLLYGSYFGGPQSREHVDGGTSRFDKKGIIYQSVCAGCGGNDDFPVTAGAWPHTGADVNHSGNCNNGVFKIDFQLAFVKANFTKSTVSGCAPLTVNFQNQSADGTHYLWNFGGGDTTSIVLNPVRTFSVAGTYTVTLVVTDSLKCNITDSTKQVITVFPPFNANFTSTRVKCSNTINFTDNSAPGPLSWQWNFGDAQGASTQSPTHIYAGPGSYSVSLVATNTNGCKDTIVHTVTVPTATVSLSPSFGLCLGDSVQLDASGGISYTWTPASDLSQVNVPNPMAFPSSTTAYTVHMHYINSLGDTCQTALSTTVTVVNPGTFSLSATASPDTIVSGTSTTLTAAPFSAIPVNWLPATGLSNPTSYTTIATPSVTTNYTVTMQVSGCKVSATVLVIVMDNFCHTEDAFVPNTFTPNGDFNNDVLYVRGKQLREVYFAVYDRWGELVFETKDKNKGWDGVYKGRPSDPGVFGYYLKASCWGGSEIIKKGNVTLIR